MLKAQVYERHDQAIALSYVRDPGACCQELRAFGFEYFVASLIFPPKLLGTFPGPFKTPLTMELLVPLARRGRNGWAVCGGINCKKWN